MELQRLVLITRSVQVCVWVLRMREKTECGVRSTGQNVIFSNDRFLSRLQFMEAQSWKPRQADNLRKYKIKQIPKIDIL